MEGGALQNRATMSNSFAVLHSAAGLAARVGKFAVPNRKTIQTPHYVAITSRGIVPHLSQDVARNHTSIGSLYIGLEDFLEKALTEVPPIFNIPTETEQESRLRKFIAAQDDDILMLGPRRGVPVVVPQHNLAHSIAISTSFGIQLLKEEKYLEAINTLRPDIVIGLADISYGIKPGVKRRATMADRTHAYTRDGIKWLYENANEDNQALQTLYFAPILPLDNTQQGLYIQDLEEEYRPNISGLALYDSASLSIIPKGLDDLPRLCFSEPRTPQDVLRDVALGADMLTIPFIGNLANAGVALDFIFSPPLPPKADADSNNSPNMPKPLGLNLWESDLFATQFTPLSEGCECYACQKHHRAYIHHLLAAKEMLAWSLLQIHNHHVMDVFFSAIRQSITNGTFEADAAMFERSYESSFPAQTGQGPRLRGYDSRVSKRGESRRNAPAYGRLNDAIEKYEESQNSSIATPDVDADELEKHGFAMKSADGST